MDTYIILSKLTDDGAEKIMDDPTRILAVDAELNGMGVNVKNQFAVMGPFDFVTIVEAPDAMTVLHAATQIAARGSVRVQTLHAVPVSDFVDIFTTTNRHHQLYTGS